MTREEVIEAIVYEMTQEKKDKWKSRAKKTAIGAGIIGVGVLATKAPKAKRYHALGKKVSSTVDSSAYRQALVSKNKYGLHVDKYYGSSSF
jgi:hypothetical protein